MNNLRPGEFPIDYNTCELCKLVVKKNVVASRCLRTLSQHVLSTGPNFYKNEIEQALSENFSEFLKEYWYPYCNDLIESIASMGFVSTFLRKEIKNNEAALVPAVYKGTMGQDHFITTYTINGKTEYTFYKKGKNMTWKRSNKVKVWTGFGYDPTSKGIITSIVSTIIPAHYWLEKLSKYTLQADFNRANPTIITQTTLQTTDLLDKESSKFNLYGDVDYTEFQDLAKYKYNQQELNQIESMQEQAISKSIVNEITERARTNPSLIDHAQKQTVDNIYVLPAGHVVAHQPLPVSRTDWVDVNRHNENIICAAFGVPRSNFINDSGISENSAKTSEKSFYQNVNSFGRILSEILTFDYRKIYGFDDNVKELKKIKDNLHEMTEEELFLNAKRNQVTVQFQFSPAVPSNDLIEHYAFGVLSYKEAVQMIRTASGYPKVSIVKDKDPWNQLYKSSIMNSISTKKIGLIGNTIFPKITTENIEEKKGEKRKPEKKDKKKAKKTKNEDTNKDEETEKTNKDKK